MQSSARSSWVETLGELEKFLRCLHGRPLYSFWSCLVGCVPFIWINEHILAILYNII